MSQRVVLGRTIIASSANEKLRWLNNIFFKNCQPFSYLHFKRFSIEIFSTFLHILTYSWPIFTPPPLRNINYFWHEPKNKNQEKIYYLQNSMPQLCSTYRWIPCPRVESIGKVAYNKKCVFDFGVYFKKKMLNIKMTPLEYQTLPQKS